MRHKFSVLTIFLTLMFCTGWVAPSDISWVVRKGVGVTYVDPGGIPGICTNGWLTIKGVLPDAQTGLLSDLTIAGHTSYMLGIFADNQPNPCMVMQVQVGPNGGDPLLVYSGGDASIRYRIAQLTNNGGLILSDRKDKSAGIFAIDGELYAVDNDNNMYPLTEPTE